MSLRKSASKSAARVANDSFERLEDRKLMAASPAEVIGIKIAKRVDTDGSALNSNRITIAFAAKGALTNLRLGDTTQYRSFGYANDLTTPNGQRKVTVGLTLSIPEQGVLQIITDRLVRKGSRLQIFLGGLKDSRGNDIVFDASSAAKTITFVKGQNKPRYTLSNRNFRPTDLSYFTPAVFASAPTPTTASAGPSAGAVRIALVNFMNQKVAKKIITAAQAADAVAIYDSSTAAGLIPSPNLRAGLASLVGTVGEPAIQSYIGKSNVTGKPYSFIGFSSTISNSAPIGETKVLSNGRLNLVVRPTFNGEDFRALSAMLAHESMHQDPANTVNEQGVPPNSQDEEIINNAVQTTVYIQQAQADSGFVGNGTNLVNQINDQVLAILNSGDKLFPYGGIFQNPAISSNGNVFIGAKTNVGNFGNNTPVSSFADFLRREYVFRGIASGGTPSSPTAVAILQNIVGTSGNFTLLGSQVEDYLDTRNFALTDVTYINMARALKLNF